MLQDKVKEYIGTRNLEKKTIPTSIRANLAPSKPFRPYQTECMQYFLSYREDYNERLSHPHLLFNMATGSGKTIIMAATILYLYEKGYRNFLFFVNTTNIIEKTRDNFFNPTSSKYLFAQSININGRRVEVREVESFQGVNNDCINICLKTLGKLHSELNTPRENGATYEDYAQTPVVLIADEAHHLNGNTKKSKKVYEGEVFGGEYKEFDDEDSRNWETTAQRIFLQNEKNIMLEFTATHDIDNENIRKKYEDKLIYRYDLVRFCKDKYSKDVQTVMVDRDIQGRMITVLIVSEYKRMLFASLGKSVKPVILFKSKLKSDNANAFNGFVSMLHTIDAKVLADIKSSSTEGIIKDAFDYMQSHNISLDDLALMISEQFSEEHLLMVDGNTKMKKTTDMTADMQQLLNSLEEQNNPIRGIFAVEMLNEGWDVLNLFDIVRLYDSRDPNTKKKKPGKTTMQEAQLIGRGARYYAFKDKNLPGVDADKRKYDKKIDSPLRNIETLHYYCPNEPNLIKELHAAFREIGLEEKKEYVSKDLFLKDDFMQSELYKTGIVFFNEKLLKAVAEDDGTIGDTIKGKTYNVKMHTGSTVTSYILDKEDIATDSDYKNLVIHMIELGANVIRMALDCFSPFYYCNLKKVFPSLLSMTTFIESENYLSNISVSIMGPYNKINDYSQSEKLYIAKKVLQQIEPHVLKRKEIFIGSHKFLYKPINKAFTKRRTMNFVKNAEDSIDERGIPMLESKDPKLRIDLSKRAWHAYNDCFGSSEEKALVEYIDGISGQLAYRYDDFYLLRNEKDIILYGFDNGERFEPDYLLFMRKRNYTNRYDHIQIFLEPKGKGYKEKDKWKEDFLKQMNVDGNVRLCIESNEYRVWGMPFFTENENKEFRNTFENTILNTEDFSVRMVAEEITRG